MSGFSQPRRVDFARQEFYIWFINSEIIMKFETTFNNYFGKELAKTDEPEQKLKELLARLEGRTLELNSARKKMSVGFGQVLEALAEAYPTLDLNDPNLTDTPNRTARALLEVCSGLGAVNSDAITTTFPAEDYNDVILLKNIDFTSLCSHHFFPFSGVAHVGYLPDPKIGSKVLGLSKLARIVDIHAQRPQLQERLCQDVMKALKEELRPAGVMVVVEAAHGCLNCRGAKKINASMMTSSVYGKFKEDIKLREEFLALIRA